MAIVNVSLDTVTRQMVLTIDGVIVPHTEVNVQKWVFDGEEELNFSYTSESVNANGMQERRQFFLPSPEELDVIAKDDLDKNGFASKIVHNDEKAKADVIDFLRKED